MESQEVDARAVAAVIDDELRALPLVDSPHVRAVRQRYSHELRRASPGFILDLARELLGIYGRRWVAYELIAGHEGALRSLGATELEELGRGIDSWGAVDSFARSLAGPAWLKGRVPDGLIDQWAHSDDRWWRRAALVSTVALNVRSKGGRGDIPRTLRICRLLAGDPDDMVVKALSWALRELVPHDPEAVRTFLCEREQVLAARVMREVNNKLRTGLKNPSPRCDG